MNDKDVTSLVDFGFNDDECLPITKCVCGGRFDPWEFIISVYRDGAHYCPNCGVRLYFTVSLKVFEVQDG